MASLARYEILDTIASGDFAAVYRARDRELGREVAVKQIHQQYLSDPRRLARFWQEAQLLASLQHPNIVTIYDLVRPSGCLILELMRGSLKSTAQGEPMDLDSLRLVLVCALGGLQFLHSNGVIHGDIKPGNLLVDAQGRVKLGDFGLARRVANEEGSLLKGTTKYMAPEMLASQFGPVGPSSDLYSLGFSAYELMCGGQFEALFPTLGSFGADKQVAWMMWQAAPDRQLPQIGQVLQGVPDDLARVIQRLVAKEQKQRYRSAAEALGDLRADRLHLPGSEGPPPPPDESAAKRKRRLVLAGALALSCVAALAILLAPNRKPPPKSGAPPVERGLVRAVRPEEHSIELELSGSGEPKEITIVSTDEIYVNGKADLLRNLQKGDRLLLKTVFDQWRQSHRQIFASRAEIGRGTVAQVIAAQGILKLNIVDADGNSRQLAALVPDALVIEFNGKPQFNNKAVKLADLLPGDQVIVHHLGQDTEGQEQQRTATALSVRRVVTDEGTVDSVDTIKRVLTFSLGKAPPAQEPATAGAATKEPGEQLSLPLADGCEITVNGMRISNQQLLKPTDLRPGDKVRVSHDSAVLRIDAYRILGQSGTIAHAEYNSRLLEITAQGQALPLSVLVPAACCITLMGEPAQFDDLRVGDQVEISHDNPGAKVPTASALAARRPADPDRWALLVSNEDLEDVTVSKPAYATADAKWFRQILAQRYKVPEEQILLLADESLIRLQQGIPAFLDRLPAEAKLLIYVAGQGYQDHEGKIYLASKNFMLAQPAASGLPLQWLLDQLEQCKAAEKLLLLDASHEGKGADLKQQPSSAEMLRTLQGPPGLAALRTVTAIASCKAGQRGADLRDQRHGLFASCLAEGYAGAADKNRDTRIEPTELFDYLTEAMAGAAGKLHKTQTAELFLPNARPSRLTEQAKKGIRTLLEMLRADQVDAVISKKECQQVEGLCGKESEPRLLYGLLLMKAKQRDKAQQRFEELSAEQPHNLWSVQGLAWLQFEQLSARSGVNYLTELAGRIPIAQHPDEPLAPPLAKLLFWMGQLREFAAAAIQENRRPSEGSLADLDAAVAQRGASAVQCYEQGRKKSAALMAHYDAKIASAGSEAEAARLRVERRQLAHYVGFPYDEAIQAIDAGLDQ